MKWEEFEVSQWGSRKRLFFSKVVSRNYRVFIFMVGLQSRRYSDSFVAFSSPCRPPPLHDNNAEVSSSTCILDLCLQIWISIWYSREIPLFYGDNGIELHVSGNCCWGYLHRWCHHLRRQRTDDLCDVRTSLFCNHLCTHLDFFDFKDTFFSPKLSASNNSTSRLCFYSRKRLEWRNLSEVMHVYIMSIYVYRRRDDNRWY
jgi:hypothetical protein